MIQLGVCELGGTVTAKIDPIHLVLSVGSWVKTRSRGLMGQLLPPNESDIEGIALHAATPMY